MDKFLNTLQLILLSLMLVISLIYVFVLDYVGFKVGALIITFLVARGIKYLADERKSIKEISK